MAAEKPIIDKWNRWFDVISTDVVSLHFYRKMYRDVGSMVKANPAIRKPNAFYKFVANGYVALTLIIVRRQVAERKDSISLARLLSDISEHPTELSRQHYHKLCAGRGFGSAQIDRSFQHAVGETGRDFINLASVLNDLTTLKDVTKLLHKYTDKRVAHIDVRTWTQSMPTFGDLDAAIDTLARVCRKYSVLLRAEQIPSFEPIIQHDWQAVFRVPWIPDETGAQTRGSTSHVS